MIYFFQILLVLLGLIFSKFKGYNLLVIVYLTVTIFVTRNVDDFFAYQNVYDFIGKEGNQYLNTGYGWWLLCRIGNLFSLNYADFRTILYACSLILIILAIKKLNIDDNKTLACFLLYPALSGLIQTRFFVAMSVVFFLIPFLIKNTLKGYIIYGLGVFFIAGQIHAGAFFYLIFLIWKLCLKYYKTSSICMIMLFIIFFFNRNILVNVISNFGTNQENDLYFKGGFHASFSLTLLYIITELLFILISFYQYFTIDKNQTSSISVSFIQLEIFSNIVCLFLCLVSSYAFTFLRLQRLMWLINYSGLVLYSKGSLNRNQKIIYWTSLFINIVLAIIWTLFVSA